MEIEHSQTTFQDAIERLATFLVDAYRKTGFINVPNHLVEPFHRLQSPDRGRLPRRLIDLFDGKNKQSIIRLAPSSFYFLFTILLLFPASQTQERLLYNFMDISTLYKDEAAVSQILQTFTEDKIDEASVSRRRNYVSKKIAAIVLDNLAVGSKSQDFRRMSIITLTVLVLDDGNIADFVVQHDVCAQLTNILVESHDWILRMLAANLVRQLSCDGVHLEDDLGGDDAHNLLQSLPLAAELDAQWVRETITLLAQFDAGRQSNHESPTFVEAISVQFDDSLVIGETAFIYMSSNGIFVLYGFTKRIINLAKLPIESKLSLDDIQCKNTGLVDGSSKTLKLRFPNSDGEYIVKGVRKAVDMVSIGCEYGQAEILERYIHRHCLDPIDAHVDAGMSEAPKNPTGQVQRGTIFTDTAWNSEDDPKVVHTKGGLASKQGESQLVHKTGAKTSKILLQSPAIISGNPGCEVCSDVAGDPSEKPSTCVSQAGQQEQVYPHLGAPHADEDRGPESCNAKQIIGAVNTKRLIDCLEAMSEKPIQSLREAGIQSTKKTSESLAHEMLDLSQNVDHSFRLKGVTPSAIQASPNSQVSLHVPAAHDDTTAQTVIINAGTKCSTDLDKKVVGARYNQKGHNGRKSCLKKGSQKLAEQLPAPMRSKSTTTSSIANQLSTVKGNDVRNDTDGNRHPRQVDDQESGKVQQVSQDDRSVRKDQRRKARKVPRPILQTQATKMVCEDAARPFGQDLSQRTSQTIVLTKGRCTDTDIHKTCTQARDRFTKESVLGTTVVSPTSSTDKNSDSLCVQSFNREVFPAADQKAFNDFINVEQCASSPPRPSSTFKVSEALAMQFDVVQDSYPSKPEAQGISAAEHDRSLEPIFLRRDEKHTAAVAPKTPFGNKKRFVNNVNNTRDSYLTRGNEKTHAGKVYTATPHPYKFGQHIDDLKTPTPALPRHVMSKQDNKECKERLVNSKGLRKSTRLEKASKRMVREEPEGTLQTIGQERRNGIPAKLGTNGRTKKQKMDKPSQFQLSHLARSNENLPANAVLRKQSIVHFSKSGPVNQGLTVQTVSARKLLSTRINTVGHVSTSASTGHQIPAEPIPDETTRPFTVQDENITSHCEASELDDTSFVEHVGDDQYLCDNDRLSNVSDTGKVCLASRDEAEPNTATGSACDVYSLTTKTARGQLSNTKVISSRILDDSEHHGGTHPSSSSKSRKRAVEHVDLALDDPSHARTEHALQVEGIRVDDVTQRLESSRCFAETGSLLARCSMISKIKENPTSAANITLSKVDETGTLQPSLTTSTDSAPKMNHFSSRSAQGANVIQLHDRGVLKGLSFKDRLKRSLTPVHLTMLPSLKRRKISNTSATENPGKRLPRSAEMPHVSPLVPPQTVPKMRFERLEPPHVLRKEAPSDSKTSNCEAEVTSNVYRLSAPDELNRPDLAKGRSIDHMNRDAQEQQDDFDEGAAKVLVDSRSTITKAFRGGPSARSESSEDGSQSSTTSDTDSPSVKECYSNMKTEFQPPKHRLCAKIMNIADAILTQLSKEEVAISRGLTAYDRGCRVLLHNLQEDLVQKTDRESKNINACLYEERKEHLKVSALIDGLCPTLDLFSNVEASTSKLVRTTEALRDRIRNM